MKINEECFFLIFWQHAILFVHLGYVLVALVLFWWLLLWATASQYIFLVPLAFSMKVIIQENKQYINKEYSMIWLSRQWIKDAGYKYRYRWDDFSITRFIKVMHFLISTFLFFFRIQFTIYSKS